MGIPYTTKDGWILHRTKTAATADTDWVDAQTDLIGSTPADSMLIRVTPHSAAGSQRAAWSPTSLRIKLKFLDATGAVLKPSDHTTNKRGIVTITVLEIVTLQDGTTALADDVTISDSASEVGATSYTDYVIPVAPGVYFIRLSAITFPTGGGTATNKIQVWVKPHQN